MPLLAGFVEDGGGRGPDDDYLAVAEVRYVEQGLLGGGRGGGGRRRRVVVEESPAGGGRAEPFVRTAGCSEGLLVGFLQAADGVGLVGGGGAFDFEGPEVEDQAGPETIGCLAEGDGEDGGENRNVRCMASGSGGPGSHAVVDGHEVVLSEHCVVAVRHAADHAAVDFGTAISTAVVGAEGVGEGAGGWGEEGGWEGSGGPLCEEGIAGVEVEG